jgi:hypothetical protein
MKNYQIRMAKKLFKQGWKNNEIANNMGLPVKSIDQTIKFFTSETDFEIKSLLTNLPLNYMQHLYEQKLATEGFKINGKNVYEDDSSELYIGEKFKKHPNTNLLVSNYGRIKKNNKFIKQEIEKEGYLYVNLLYSSHLYEKALLDTKTFKFSTPSLAFKEIIADKEGEHIFGEHFESSHPFLPIHRTKKGHFFSMDYENKKYFYKTNTAKNGDKTFSIPIYVYRLVAETWCFNPLPEEYTEVHHIINNGYNNTIFNLLWVTHSQHKIIEKRKW